VVIDEAPAIFVSLPSDTVVEFGSTLKVEFETNSTELVDFSWTVSSPEVEMSCLDCMCPIIESVEADFFVELTARDVNGCKYITERYWISPIDNSFVDVPTGFSPNGDNRNDNLWIFGKPGVEIMNFEIFDRWGELIFSEVDFEINEDGFSGSFFWDGTFAGDEVDSGVYTWRLKIRKKDGTIKFSEGNVTLLR